MTTFGFARRWQAAAGVLLLITMLGQQAVAGPLLDRLRERRQASQTNELEQADGAGHIVLPAGVRVLRDLAYGADKLQKIDAYLPAQANAAPIIVMVHGGGWRRGDKTATSVVQNKLNHWVPKGFILVSVDYPMLPDTDPVTQAQNVAQALALVQKQASTWGGDASKVILMGHSAGAHLVALLDAAPQMAYQFGAKPWLGVVALDSAALDVPQIMQARHLPLYDHAFGSDSAYWQKASPYHQLVAGAAPFMGVCSSRRADSCPQARQFAAKAKSLGVTAQVQPEDLSHREINEQLGLDSDYTRAVDAFLGGLDGRVRQLLGN